MAFHFTMRHAALTALGLSVLMALAPQQAWLSPWPEPAQTGPHASASAQGLTLATWNLNWLMQPEVHADLMRRCAHRQPRSHDHALPCTPGREPPPSRTHHDFDALAQHAEQLRHRHHVDVLALQEVDGPDAAKQVFGPGWQLACFVRRAHPQKLGFAIRAGLPYRCEGDLDALDVDGSSRSGADITLWPDTPQAVRLLAVHLKSGCFDGRLDRRFAPCERLRQQIPVLAQWVAQRSAEGVAFAVLGDFNRRLDKDGRYEAGEDARLPLNLLPALNAAWQSALPDTAHPSSTGLLRATEGQPYQACDADDHHRAYIDDILIDPRLAFTQKNRRFARLSFDPQDRGRTLSDHCPVIWSLQP